MNKSVIKNIVENRASKFDASGSNQLFVHFISSSGVYYATPQNIEYEDEYLLLKNMIYANHGGGVASPYDKEFTELFLEYGCIASVTFKEAKGKEYL